MKTIVGLCTQPEGATEALHALERAGFAQSSMRVVRSVDALWQHLGCKPRRIVVADFAIGAALGIATYGLFGVLAAAGEVSLGFDRTTAMVAFLFSGLAGVFVGGMLGVFFGLGSMEQESRAYVNGIRRGGALVVVRTADEHAAHAMDVLRQVNAEGVKVCRRTSDTAEPHGLPRPKDRLSLWTRWAARALGTALLLLVMLLFIGEGLLGEDTLNPLALSLPQDLLLLALLVALAGVVVAWRWEAIGAVLILGSVLLFESVNAINSGHWRIGVLDVLFVLAGLLFLYDGLRTLGSGSDRPTATPV